VPVGSDSEMSLCSCLSEEWSRSFRDDDADATSYSSTLEESARPLRAFTTDAMRCDEKRRELLTRTFPKSVFSEECGSSLVKNSARPLLQNLQAQPLLPSCRRQIDVEGSRHTRIMCGVSSRLTNFEIPGIISLLNLASLVSSQKKASKSLKGSDIPTFGEL